MKAAFLPSTEIVVDVVVGPLPRIPLEIVRPMSMENAKLSVETCPLWDFATETALASAVPVF